MAGDHFYLAIFYQAGNYGRRFAQQGRLNLGIGFDCRIEIMAGLIYGRLNVRKERADLPGDFLAVNCGFHRATIAVAHYQNYFGAQDRGAVFDAADNFRSENISGYAIYENVADSLVED